MFVALINVTTFWVCFQNYLLFAWNRFELWLEFICPFFNEMTHEIRPMFIFHKCLMRTEVWAFDNWDNINLSEEIFWNFAFISQCLIQDLLLFSNNLILINVLRLKGHIYRITNLIQVLVFLEILLSDELKVLVMKRFDLSFPQTMLLFRF